MSVKNYVFPVPIDNFDVADINPALLLPINAGGFPHPLILLRIVNQSNIAVFLSWDGVTGHDVVAANSSVEYNFQSNSQPNNSLANVKQGQVIYVTAPAAGVGDVWLVGFYQPLGT